jgi:hypothetical protein
VNAAKHAEESGPGRGTRASTGGVGVPAPNATSGTR